MLHEIFFSSVFIFIFCINYSENIRSDHDKQRSLTERLAPVVIHDDDHEECYGIASVRAITTCAHKPYIIREENPDTLVWPCGHSIVGNETIFLWHVAIFVYRPVEQEYKYQCGGSVVDKDFIVSGARNERRTNLEDYRVIAGKKVSSYYTMDTANHQEFNISQLIYPEKGYNPQYDNSADIVLVKITVPSSAIPLHPVCVEKFAELGFIPERNDEGIVPGWNGSKPASELQMDRVPFINSSDCRHQLAFLTIDQFCCGPNRKGEKLPQGYSGGGIVSRKGSVQFLRCVVSPGVK